MAPPNAEEGIASSPALLPALPESIRPVQLPRGGRGWRRLVAFMGPGYLVAVGYMDPGNWATGTAGGSAYGYSLLSVVLLSSLMAMLLQGLALRLGIASGRDLAQLCREAYGPRLALALWGVGQLAIVACDLAEVIGTAIALQMLFGLPLFWGVCVTVFNVLLLLTLPRLGIRWLEAMVCGLMLVVVGCFVVELGLAQPDLAAIAAGFLPQSHLLVDPQMLYVAIGIIGATVMPHNLYLHAAIVRTRGFGANSGGRREAIRFAGFDNLAAMGLAFFVNVGIVILAASTFHAHGRADVTDLAQAYRLLSPMLGASTASLLFAVALLAAGQNSAVAVTLAGQIMTDGFLGIRLPPGLGRLATRMMAVVPAAAVILCLGEAATGRLLVLSQVVLSLQLPFAVLPLIRFTSDPARMGPFVSPPWLTVLAACLAALLLGLNFLLVFDAVV